MHRKLRHALLNPTSMLYRSHPDQFARAGIISEEEKMVRTNRMATVNGMMNLIDADSGISFHYFVQIVILGLLAIEAGATEPVGWETLSLIYPTMFFSECYETSLKTYCS